MSYYFWLGIDAEYFHWRDEIDALADDLNAIEASL